MSLYYPVPVAPRMIDRAAPRLASGECVPTGTPDATH